MSIPYPGILAWGFWHILFASPLSVNTCIASCSDRLEKSLKRNKTVFVCHKHQAAARGNSIARRRDRRKDTFGWRVRGRCTTCSVRTVPAQHPHSVRTPHSGQATPSAKQASSAFVEPRPARGKYELSKLIIVEANGTSRGTTCSWHPCRESLWVGRHAREKKPGNEKTQSKQWANERRSFFSLRVYCE